MIPLVELMHECTVIVATTVWFVVHRDFHVLFKQWEQNPCYNMYVCCSLSCVSTLARIFSNKLLYEVRGLPLHEFAHLATCGNNTSFGGKCHFKCRKPSGITNENILLLHHGDFVHIW